LVGSLALDALARLRADVALIGASGLHPADGATTTELLEASIKHQWIQKSGRACLLADASKWRQPAPIRFAAWGEFQEFFTDTRPPPAFHRKTPRIILP
jgi:DeoR family fructose operon transcriptional repressor